MDEKGIIDGSDIILAGMIGMFLLSIIIISFVIFYQRKLLYQERKHNKAESEYQKSLLNASIESQEQERIRVGTELHDSVGVMLSAASLHLQYYNEISLLKNKAPIDKIENILQKTIETVRSVSADLRPAILEDHGLIEAILELTQSIKNTGKLEVSLSHEYLHLLSREQELMLYRITQELLTNTIRHANASSVIINLKSDETGFYFTYRDNGKGISKVPGAQNSKGLGLKNIESRALAMNGLLSISSPETGGLEVTLQIEKK